MLRAGLGPESLVLRRVRHADAGAIDDLYRVPSQPPLRIENIALQAGSARINSRVPAGATTGNGIISASSRFFFMRTTPPIPADLRLRCGHCGRDSGLTLVEVMVSCAMIVLVCTSFMTAFTQLNQMAMVSRLYTGAYAQAQSQIDLIASDTPFQPQNGLIPTELTPGTTTATVAVYQDPVSNNTINGTMTTTVASSNTTYTQGSITETLYLYEAYVNVAYTYRGRNYNVSFSTLRTSDI